MTISEMHNYIKFEVDKTSSLILPAFLSEEIDYVINSSINEIVLDTVTKSLEKPYRTIPRALDKINTLIETTTIIPSADTSIDSNGVVVTLPLDYLYFISARATLTVGTSTVNVPVKQIPYDLVSEELANPFGYHILRLGEARPLMFEDNGQFMLITDGTYTITGVKFTYIKTPAVVDFDSSTDCDLPESLHLQVVKLAANMLLENIQSERYQSHSIEVAHTK